MDSSIPVGGGYRIGVDGLIDLVPGIGDVAGVLVSAYIIYLAATCGAPESVLRRMAANVLIDALLGAFPLIGAVADSAFKANVRNAAIFEEFLKIKNGPLTSSMSNLSREPNSCPCNLLAARRRGSRPPGEL